MAKNMLSEAQFWSQRLAKTALRAFHILGIVGAGGGILLQVPQEHWLNYWILAMVTGSILMLWELIRDWRWIIQLKGVLTLAKVGLLCLFIPLSQYKPSIFVTVLLLSVIVSHGPAGLRHYSVVHRRRIDSKKEIKG